MDYFGIGIGRMVMAVIVNMVAIVKIFKFSFFLGKVRRDEIKKKRNPTRRLRQCTVAGGTLSRGVAYEVRTITILYSVHIIIYYIRITSALCVRSKISTAPRVFGGSFATAWRAGRSLFRGGVHPPTAQ